MKKHKIKMVVEFETFLFSTHSSFSLEIFAISVHDINGIIHF